MAATHCERATRRGRCLRPATSTFLFPFTAATLTERYCTHHGRAYAEQLREAGVVVRVLGHPLVVAAYAAESGPVEAAATARSGDGCATAQNQEGPSP